ncbi:MAG: hypothetical protein ACK4G3_01070 [bacterium]
MIREKITSPHEILLTRSPAFTTYSITVLFIPKTHFIIINYIFFSSIFALFEDKIEILEVSKMQKIKDLWAGRAWWEIALFLILAIAAVVVVVILFGRVVPDFVITGAVLFYLSMVIVFLALFFLHIFGIYGEPPLMSRLIYDHRGNMSLGKFQLVFWTFILGGALLYHIGQTGTLPAGVESFYLGLTFLFSGVIYLLGKFLKLKYPS